jgi:hypothetical protein
MYPLKSSTKCTYKIFSLSGDAGAPPLRGVCLVYRSFVYWHYVTAAFAARNGPHSGHGLPLLRKYIRNPNAERIVVAVSIDPFGCADPINFIWNSFDQNLFAI